MSMLILLTFISAKGGAVMQVWDGQKIGHTPNVVTETETVTGTMTVTKTLFGSQLLSKTFDFFCLL